MAGARFLIIQRLLVWFTAFTTGEIMINFADINLGNPKRLSHSKVGWEGFFPYYAGFPEAFVSNILHQLRLPPNTLVADPWNGSGTTTYASNVLGLPSWGGDVNPAMVIVAKARLLPPSEADSLVPLAHEICRLARRLGPGAAKEPLSQWFDQESAVAIRAIELSIRRHLIGRLSAEGSENRLQHMSTLAAAFYVALFASVRSRLVSLRTSNPTWLRKNISLKISVAKDDLHKEFKHQVVSMAASLQKSLPPTVNSFRPSILEVVDTTRRFIKDEIVDLVITSPPYCTRIDYTSSTGIELALINPWLGVTQDDLSRKMLGSIKVPKYSPLIKAEWGESCTTFLDLVKSHKSKASAGYYFKSHADYYEKLFASMVNLAACLRLGGGAVLVVQDSNYKELHNPLPQIVSEMARYVGLREVRRESFVSTRSLSRVNSSSRKYGTHRVPIETVLCFMKDGANA